MEGWYYVEHRPDGYKGKIERRKIFGIENAIALDAAIKQRKNLPPPELHPKLADVIDTYLAWVKLNQSVVTHSNKVKRYTRYIMPFFGQFRVRELSQSLFDKYAAQSSREQYRADVAMIMALVKWMHKRQLAPIMTFKPDVPKSHPAIKTIPHPSDILKAIALIGKEQTRVIFTLILFTGLRWNEASKLTWQNVDIKTEQLRIAESGGDKIDLVPIPAMLLPWFKSNQQLGGWVFKGRKKGEHIQRTNRPLKHAAKKVGIDLNPHLLRHASATLLYEATHDIYAVQHHLRHNSVITSQIYTRYSVNQKSENMGKLIEHMFNSSADDTPNNSKALQRKAK